MNCERCKFKASRLEMVAPACSGMVDYCKKGNRYFFDPKPQAQTIKVDMWMDSKVVEWPVDCADHKQTLRSKVSDWWEKLQASQVTEYEKHMHPK